jgi:hypothetical protein
MSDIWNVEIAASLVRKFTRARCRAKRNNDDATYVFARSAESVLGPNYFACFLQTHMTLAQRNTVYGVVCSLDDRDDKNSRTQSSCISPARGRYTLRDNGCCYNFIYDRG